MSVCDLKTDKGVGYLNDYLADRSYIEGYQPTQADAAVFEALGKPPTQSSNHHVHRWYNHVKTYDLKTLPGVKKVPDIFGASAKAPAPPSASASSTTKANDDDDDLDLFGSDEEEDAEVAKVREERLKAYAEKKSNKPTVIAKSSVVLDVKTWGDEIDMQQVETAVRSIEMDGLLWGGSKLVPVGYGMSKLQIMCVIEDEKVSVDLLIEQIQDFEDLVQSVDIASFNKI